MPPSCILSHHNFLPNKCSHQYWGNHGWSVTLLEIQISANYADEEGARGSIAAWLNGAVPRIFKSTRLMTFFPRGNQGKKLQRYMIGGGNTEMACSRQQRGWYSLRLGHARLIPLQPTANSQHVFHSCFDFLRNMRSVLILDLLPTVTVSWHLEFEAPLSKNENPTMWSPTKARNRNVADWKKGSFSQS